MIPDHTLYVAGMIEYSPDTTHHYPQIVVSYFTQVIRKDEPYSGEDYLMEYTDIYTPMLLRQIVATAHLFQLKWEPETKAIVSIKGPLGTTKEKKVIFTHEGHGIYGDVNYALPRIPNGKYKLRITLPNGSTFGAVTHIPEPVNLTIPDSIGILVKFGQQGPPLEKHINRHEILIPTPKNALFTIMQWNTSLDRELLLMKQDEHFHYTNRSNYLRTGIGLFVDFVRQSSDVFSPGWSQTLDKHQDEIWMKQHYWLRISFQSKGIGKLYFPLMNIYSATEEWEQVIQQPKGDALAQRDTTYLFNASTIYKIGKNGILISASQSRDVFGFFSGYYSLYKQFTVYPIRNFDLDSVLTLK